MSDYLIGANQKIQIDSLKIPLLERLQLQLSLGLLSWGQVIPL